MTMPNSESNTHSSVQDVEAAAFASLTQYRNHVIGSLDSASELEANLIEGDQADARLRMLASLEAAGVTFAPANRVVTHIASFPLRAEEQIRRRPKLLEALLVRLRSRFQ